MTVRAARRALGAGTALALSALSAGCARDDIIVYRMHAEGGPDGEGGSGAPEGKAGGPAGSAGAGSGGTHMAGAPGAGGREPPPFDASARPLTGNGGGQMSAGAAGALATAGAGGDVGRGTGGVPGLPGTCSAATDCPSAFTCQKIDCSAPTGFCQPRPILCDPSPVPVCGCDGVTYWNDCLRQQDGVPASTPNQCIVNPRTCTTSTDCGVAGASCAHLNPIPSQACGAPGPGTCWMLPLDCTTTQPTPSWTPCQGPPPGPSPRPTCVSTCEAIRSGQEYLATMPGPQCR